MKAMRLKIPLLISTLALVLISCEEIELTKGIENQFTTEALAVIEPVDTSTVTAVDSFRLYTADIIETVYLKVNNDDEYLYLTYVITHPDYNLDTVRLWVGTDPTMVPVDDEGNPDPLQFPVTIEALANDSLEFTVSLNEIFSETDEICGRDVYIFANGTLKPAEGSGVEEGEMIWSEGTEFESNSWGWYSIYTIVCPDDDEGDEDDPEVTGYVSETAFAKFSIEDGGYVFSSRNFANPEGYPSLDLIPARWGWAVNLTEGSFTGELYAGAGINDISKGYYVGELKVTVTDTSATVMYSLFEDHLLREAHVYLGDAMPEKIAPGQFGHTVEFEEDVAEYTYDVEVSDEDGDGMIWLIAHGVVSIPQY